MRVLITGAAGKLGTPAGNALIDAGWDVIGWDLRPREDARFPIVIGDLRDLSEIANRLRGYDAVVHLAAGASVNTSVPGGVFAANTRIDTAILRGAAEAGVRRVLFASSVQVINGEDGINARPPPFQPATLPLDGQTPAQVCPANPYARGKYATEALMAELSGTHPDRSWVIVRFPWVIAPAERAWAMIRLHAESRGHDAFSFLPLEEVGPLVVAVLRAAPTGCRRYFPTARENLLFAPPARVIRDYFPDVPKRGTPGELRSLADDRALTADTGWEPAPVNWPERRMHAWRSLLHQRPVRRWRSRWSKFQQRVAHQMLALRAPLLGCARVTLAANARLGESPCWDERTGRLLWVDIPVGAVHRLDPATGIDEVVSTGVECVSAVVPTEDERLLVALPESLAWLDFDQRALTPHTGGRFEGAPNRLNDGKCDPEGRLWIGSMHQLLTAPTGALFCVANQGPAERKTEGVTCSNGLAWSPDGRSLHYIDSGKHTLETFDFDAASGTLGARRAVLRISPRLGTPDGACVDCEGFVWVALHGGGCVIRVDPRNGHVAGRVSVPTSQVTSCAFGGPDLADLFITTARDGLDAFQLANQPLAGAIFQVRPGVRGLRTSRFRSTR